MKIKMSRIVAAAMSGNILEFYDMLVYAFLAPIIAQNFFPKEDKLAGIASTFAIFFIGYLARPLGAIVFGRIGDTIGRKPALITSIWLMAFSTFCLGLLPGYQTIGLWAPLLLLFMRLIQGLSFGSELTNSIIFVVEHAPLANRGFYGSFGKVGFSLGLLLASFITWMIHTLFSPSEVLAWAWRLPFLLASLGGFVGWLARRGVPETQSFLEIHQLPDTYFGLRRHYAKQLRPALFIIGIVLFGSVLGYLIYVFFITYMTDVLHYTAQQALSIEISSVILLVLLEPWMGKLSDRIGRRPLLAFAMINSVIWIGPYFFLLQQHNLALALLAQCVMTLFMAAYYAIDIVTMVEIVPVQIRGTVVSVAYAVAASLFAGMTPFLATLLIKVTHAYISLVIYVTIAALISLLTVYKVRETKPIPK